MVLLKCSSTQSWYRFGEPTQAKVSFSSDVSRLMQARGNRILMVCNEYSQKGWEAEAEQKKMNQETLEKNNPEAKVEKRQGGVHIISEWWQRGGGSTWSWDTVADTSAWYHDQQLGFQFSHLRLRDQEKGGRKIVRSRGHLLQDSLF